MAPYTLRELGINTLADISLVRCDIATGRIIPVEVTKARERLAAARANCHDIEQQIREMGFSPDEDGGI